MCDFYTLTIDDKHFTISEATLTRSNLLTKIKNNEHDDPYIYYNESKNHFMIDRDYESIAYIISIMRYNHKVNLSTLSSEMIEKIHKDLKYFELVELKGGSDIDISDVNKNNDAIYPFIPIINRQSKPISQHPLSQHSQSQHPQSQHPSQHPLSQHPSQHPSQHQQSQHPSQHQQSQHQQNQHRDENALYDSEGNVIPEFEHYIKSYSDEEDYKEEEIDFLNKFKTIKLLPKNNSPDNTPVVIVSDPIETLPTNTSVQNTSDADSFDTSVLLSNDSEKIAVLMNKLNNILNGGNLGLINLLSTDENIKKYVTSLGFEQQMIDMNDLSDGSFDMDLDSDDEVDEVDGDEVDGDDDDEVDGGDNEVDDKVDDIVNDKVNDEVNEKTNNDKNIQVIHTNRKSKYMTIN